MKLRWKPRKNSVSQSKHTHSHWHTVRRYIDQIVILFLIIDKDNAEAQVSNFNFEFRKNDPDNRLRVEAIVELTVESA